MPQRRAAVPLTMRDAGQVAELWGSGTRSRAAFLHAAAGKDDIVFPVRTPGALGAAVF